MALKVGSGSRKNESTLKVVPMEKETQTRLVHHQRFGEGERFANKARQALSEGIIPTFHMSRCPCFFSDRCVLFLRDDCLISSPEIREATASTVSCWNSLPQASALVAWLRSPMA